MKECKTLAGLEFVILVKEKPKCLQLRLFSLK